MREQTYKQYCTPTYGHVINRVGIIRSQILYLKRVSLCKSFERKLSETNLNELAGLRLNFEIIGNFRNFHKFHGHFVKRQKITPTDDFWGRRHVLESSYGFIK